MSGDETIRLYVGTYSDLDILTPIEEPGYYTITTHGVYENIGIGFLDPSGGGPYGEGTGTLVGVNVTITDRAGYLLGSTSENLTQFPIRVPTFFYVPAQVDGSSDDLITVSAVAQDVEQSDGDVLPVQILPVQIAVTVNGQPVIAAPSSVEAPADEATPIPGVSISETGDTNTETFTVVLIDDNGDGDLSASGSGVYGNGTTSLTVVGSLAQVNNDLATLKDTDATGGTGRDPTARAGRHRGFHPVSDDFGQLCAFHHCCRHSRF